MSGLFLDTTASGYAWLTMPTLRRYQWLDLLLRLRYGFSRAGREVLGPGESIYPDYIRGSLRLLAGQDEWVGFQVLSTDRASDEFLRRLYSEHCRPPSRGV